MVIQYIKCMNYIYSKSHRGFLHAKKKKKCQDFSCFYNDSKKTIISCADGHGSDIYIRSHVGSKFACNSVIDVFQNINLNNVNEISINNNVLNQIKISILCKWNEMVEKHLNLHPIHNTETKFLKESEKLKLMNHPFIAYGTTLVGAILLGNKLLVVKIGDSEVYGISEGNIIKIFEEENEPVGNATHSLCEQDAFNHIKITICNFNNLDGIFLCTDGLSTPFESYEDLNNLFFKPLINKIINSKDLNDVDLQVVNIAQESGVGDDVSLAFILKQL